MCLVKLQILFGLSKKLWLLTAVLLAVLSGCYMQNNRLIEIHQILYMHGNDLTTIKKEKKGILEILKKDKKEKDVK